jgi:hypothetical protein
MEESIMKKIITSAICLLISQNSLALFCPGNFNQINIGDSLESVIQQCGAPSSQTTATNTDNLPQEWNYYFKLSPTDQATMRATIAFAEGKATNMSINMIGVSVTAICGPTIQIGDTTKAIKKACGSPAFITQSSLPGSSTTPLTKTTTLIYQTPSATVSLTFENGKLTGRT